MSLPNTSYFSLSLIPVLSMTNQKWLSNSCVYICFQLEKEWGRVENTPFHFIRALLGNCIWYIFFQLEMSGSFGDSGVSCDVLWKRSYERLFCWGRHMRGRMIFGKSLSRTQQTVNDALSLVCPAKLCWLLLVFAGYHFVERNVPNNLSWYCSCFLPLP